MTLQDKIKELGEKSVRIEEATERHIAKIDREIEELEKLACEECEGIGVFTFPGRYPDYVIDTCKYCNGTGFRRD